MTELICARVGRILIVGVVFVLAAAGCSVQPPLIGSNAVSFNLALERVQNRVLLLNVLRAMKRRPRHYSSPTQFRGNLSQSAEVGFELPFGSDAMANFKISPKATASNSPNFDVAVLDSQKFVRGITTPVATTVFQYLWDYGWPRDVLLHLLINEVRLRHSGRIIDSLPNYPPDHGQFRRFGRFVEQLIVPGDSSGDDAFDFVFEAPKPVGPEMPPSKVSAEALTSAYKEKLDVRVEKNGNIRFYLPTAPVVLRCKRCREAVRAVELRLPYRDADVSVVSRLIGGDIEKLQAQRAREVPSDDEKQVTIEFVLRSPDAMVHYLGELAREQQESALEPPLVTLRVHDARSRVPLFEVRHGRSQFAGEGAFTSADYDGEAYYIPDSGRAGTCFSLLSNVFALYKESEDLPRTGTVTVQGAR